MYFPKTDEANVSAPLPVSCWDLLERHYANRKPVDIRELNSIPGRFDRLSCSIQNLTFDYSKTSMDERSLDLLLDLVNECRVLQKRDEMFSGAAINTSEQRAVMHTALRNQTADQVLVDGHDVMPSIRGTLQRMKKLCDQLHSGQLRTATGEHFTDVINIGIGGSDLGPMMATRALAPYHQGLKVHFVSNVDSAHINDTLKELDPTRTLVIVASKTFKTIETMTNANVAKSWLQQALDGNASDHLIAVSSAVERAVRFGVASERIFSFSDWVGGRYSIWGPVGLPLMLAIGSSHFDAFLRGAFEMDDHFRNSDPAENIPILLALVGIWHRNICGYGSRALLPYDQRLQRLPAYVQQLDMESNGKNRNKFGRLVQRETGPLVWGEPGTNGQHAFYQWLHQGTTIVPCEFLVAAENHEPGLKGQQDLLLANCLAQSEALMNGRCITSIPGDLLEKVARNTEAGVAEQRTCDGGRPSTTLLYRKLDPSTLGRLLALFEHRVFVEGCIWGINSFDQWGVELGKELATKLLPMIRGGDASSKDESTRGLIAAVGALRTNAAIL